MGNNNINESLALNITMNVVLITAISVLMKKDFFDDVLYIAAIAEFYGLSLILLVLFYVALELKGINHFEQRMDFYTKGLLINLAVACLVLGASMYPLVLYTVGGQGLFVFAITALVLVNISIPFLMFLSVLGRIMYDIGTGSGERYLKMSNDNRKRSWNMNKYIGRKRGFVYTFATYLLILVILFSARSIIPFVSDLSDIATIVILTITAIIYLLQNHLNFNNHLELLDSTYRIKQLEELYMPLYSVSPDFWKLDVKEIERFSYLASDELGQMVQMDDKEISLIDKFIKYLKSPDDFTFHEKNEVYEKVASAIEEDIKLLKKDLNIHL
ncbi:hypothetical protein MettiDRAFT_2378 [Methanolobus tindarius DSM 2278]|uniref:Uncharacterized protein n=1 Tax=Methanolobus tindarius DSM 2278 TaxID=1090322 RepID=W9DTC2_METTI|nr:hypothetical protein [Methanolobus tindarius]ETA68890.1 hypothetical protein MettiDRAFT_2378 [Methanolobus tindarius DSM 2278]